MSDLKDLARSFAAGYLRLLTARATELARNGAPFRSATSPFPNGKALDVRAETRPDVVVKRHGGRPDAA